MLRAGVPRGTSARARGHNFTRSGVVIALGGAGGATLGLGGGGVSTAGRDLGGGGVRTGRQSGT